MTQVQAASVRARLATWVKRATGTVSSPLSHGFPVGPSAAHLASPVPASFSAEQTSFPAHCSIKHSRLGGPLHTKNVIKFSLGFEEGRKRNNSQDIKLFKNPHRNGAMWQKSPLYWARKEFSMVLYGSYLQKFLCSIALWHSGVF